MKTDIQKNPKSQIELTVEIPSEEFEKYVQKTIESHSQNLDIKGFRKGKAPREKVEEEVGREKILIDAADLAVKETYPEVAKENNIKAVAQPKIEVVKMPTPNSSEDPFIYKAKVAVFPEVELPDYEKIASKSEKKSVEVTDEDIQKALQWLQRSRVKLSAKQGPAEKGDFVDINYSSPQIAALSKGKKDSFILGEGHFIPGFEEELVGMKAEEEKTTTLKIPADHSSKTLAGKEITFKIKMNNVQKTDFPELDDQFAKNLGKFETISQVKENIKGGLSQEKEASEKQRLRNEMLENIAKEANLEIPDELIEQEKARMLENLKKEVSQKFQTSFEEYLKQAGKTEKQILESFQEDAEKRLKKILVLMAIGEKEGIKAEEEEIKQKTDQILKSYPNPEEAKKNIDPERLKEYTKEEIKNEKTLAKLESFAKGK